MEATMTLQIEELAAKISEDLSLTRIEFDLRAGEVAAIIGPNGAGKTSLLRAICNDLGHQAGVVRFNGKDMNTWSLAERAELLAILPQRSSLEFPFTVKEVVALGRIPHSSSQRQNDAIVSEALALVDCHQFADRLYLNLSGGEKQRVQLARVAAQIWEEQEHNRCLILDEPSASLDLAHQAMIVEMIQFFASKGVTVLTVLHDLNLASQCADRLIVLKGGRLIAQGIPDQVLTSKLIAEVFEVEAQITSMVTTGEDKCSSPRVIT